MQRGNAGRKNLSLIFERIARKHATDDFDAFAHHRSRTDLFAFTFADLFHENLGRAEAEQKAFSGEILHDAGFHRDLHGMASVRRNDSPAQLNAAGLGRHHG